MKFNHPKLKKFKYLEELGKGGQGQVVKVQDPRGRRIYALKKLNEDVDIESIKNEINILQDCNHSNIVQVYDSNFDGKEGELYILMQYMKHGNIMDYLSQNPSSISEKMLLIEDVVQALRYMHRNDLVHRDIKPKNILVTNDGDGTYACLGDFGISKKLEGDITETNGGQMQGSYLYCPLEVLTGNAKQSKESDVYALGMSMYEILTGQHVQSDRNFTNYVQSVSNDIPFAKPSSYDDKLGKEIDELCLQIIAKKKEERFQTIEEFYEQLDQCISLYSNALSTNTEKDTGHIEEMLPDNMKGSSVSSNLVIETGSNVMSAEDLYSMGRNYFLGMNSYMKNKQKGIEYYEKAAKKGSSNAMNNLGDIYRTGDGVEQDDSEAVKWYRKAAEAGNSTEMCNLGWMYEFGRGVEADDGEAVNWYRKSAEAGYSKGMFNLGNMYRLGRGVKQDDSEAVNWYRKSAELGNSTGMFNLGLMYAKGRGVEQDDGEAVKWYKKSAEGGHSDGMFSLGVMYADGRGVEQDDGEAVRWYRKSAERGHSDGMVNLGVMYEKGRGVEQDDGEAVKWYRKAAELGDSDGMSNLGVMYANGRGVEQDDSEAVKWYRMSAEEEGSSAGMFNLGVMYEYGCGVEQDDSEAVKWYRKAAEAGHSGGMFNLGWMYADGCGVEQDDSEAAKWFKKAELNGKKDC